MDIPNIIGFCLKDAKAELDENGISISSIKVTAPPREKTEDYDESYRVVRQVLNAEKKIELLVCKPL